MKTEGILACSHTHTRLQKHAIKMFRPYCLLYRQLLHLYLINSSLARTMSHGTQSQSSPSSIHLASVVKQLQVQIFLMYILLWYNSYKIGELEVYDVAERWYRMHAYSQRKIRIYSHFGGFASRNTSKNSPFILGQKRKIFEIAHHSGFVF